MSNAIESNNRRVGFLEMQRDLGLASEAELAELKASFKFLFGAGGKPLAFAAHKFTDPNEWANHFNSQVQQPEPPQTIPSGKVVCVNPNLPEPPPENAPNRVMPTFKEASRRAKENTAALATEQQTAAHRARWGRS